MVQGTVVGLRVLAPHDGRGVLADQPVAEALLGAGARDGSAVEQQADGLPPFRVGAASKLVALAGDLGGDRGDGVVDESRDRAAGDIEQLA